MFGHPAAGPEAGVRVAAHRISRQPLRLSESLEIEQGMIFVAQDFGKRTGASMRSESGEESSRKSKPPKRFPVQVITG